MALINLREGEAIYLAFMCCFAGAVNGIKAGNNGCIALFDQVSM